VPDALRPLLHECYTMYSLLLPYALQPDSSDTVPRGVPQQHAGACLPHYQTGACAARTVKHSSTHLMSSARYLGRDRD
jgi:hypothetical protein